MNLFLALLPILVVLVLLVWRKMAADTAGLIGWAMMVLVTWLAFQTTWDSSSVRQSCEVSAVGFAASAPMPMRR